MQTLITDGDLAFIRDVLLPRAPVTGPEAFRLVELSNKLDRMLEEYDSKKEGDQQVLVTVTP